MSSGIRELEKFNSRQLESLKRRQAREVKQIENAHQNYKTEIKKNHDHELIDIQSEHQRNISEESDKKEKILTQMRDHLQKTQEFTGKELQALKTRSQEARTLEQTKLSAEQERIHGEHELHLAEINDRFNNQARKVHVDGQDRIQKSEEILASEFAHRQEENQSKLNHQSNTFHNQFTTDAAKYKTLKDTQDLQNKRERRDVNLKQQNEIAKMVEGHNGQIEVRNREFRKGIKTQDVMFEKKYEATLKEHQDNFKRLEGTHEKVISKMKGDLKEELKMHINRSDDPFYQFQELRPSLTHYPEHVEIKVEVPEHSKQDMQLTINNKEAIVNFNRRHDDSHASENGVVSKVHKVETFTSRLMTNYILDPKSVKATYDNGVMTYVIRKS